MDFIVPIPFSPALDRQILVPKGHKIVTGYVDVFKVKLACRERMSIGDIDMAYQKRLNMEMDKCGRVPMVFGKTTSS